MISVVLADDHVVVRTGIKMLLDADPDIEVVAEAAEGTEAYSLVARYKPDVLLLDISMPPGQSGLIACAVEPCKRRTWKCGDAHRHEVEAEALTQCVDRLLERGVLA